VVQGSGLAAHGARVVPGGQNLGQHPGHALLQGLGARLAEQGLPTGQEDTVIHRNIMFTGNRAVITVIAMRYCTSWARDWRSKAYRQVSRIP
jgi:hypothetical protein